MSTPTEQTPFNRIDLQLGQEFHKTWKKQLEEIIEMMKQAEGLKNQESERVRAIVDGVRQLYEEKYAEYNAIMAQVAAIYAKALNKDDTGLDAASETEAVTEHVHPYFSKELIEYAEFVKASMREPSCIPEVTKFYSIPADLSGNISDKRTWITPVAGNNCGLMSIFACQLGLNRVGGGGLPYNLAAQLCQIIREAHGFRKHRMLTAEQIAQVVHTITSSICVPDVYIAELVNSALTNGEIDYVQIQYFQGSKDAGQLSPIVLVNMGCHYQPINFAIELGLPKKQVIEILFQELNIVRLD